MFEKIEPVFLFINGEEIGTYNLNRVSPNDLVRDILLSATNLNYQSYDALRDLYCSAIETVVEFYTFMRPDLKGPVKAKATRFLNRADSMMKYLSRSRDGLLQKIYELCLTSEKLGLLSGFRTTNQFGDKLKGNPEIQSIK